MSNGLRRFPRRPYASDVQITDEAGYRYALEACDLSRGGVFLKTPLLLDEGEPLELDLTVEPGCNVRVRGRVCRAHEAPDSRYPAGVGVRFEEMDARSLAALERATSPPRHHYAS